MAEPNLNDAPEPPAEWMARFDGSGIGVQEAARSSWQAGWAMCILKLMEDHEGPADPIGMLAANTISQHELYASYLEAGFDTGQALHLVGLTLFASIIKP